MVYLLCYHIVYQSEANANRPIPSNSVNIVNPIINHTPFDQMFQLHPKKSRGYQIMLFITKAITWIITTWCLYCKFINIWISILKLTPQSDTLLGGASHLVNGSKKHLCIYIYIYLKYCLYDSWGPHIQVRRPARPAHQVAQTMPAWSFHCSRLPPWAHRCFHTSLLSLLLLQDFFFQYTLAMENPLQMEVQCENYL